MASVKDGPTRFRSANDRIAQLVDDPLIANDVRQFGAERERVNEIHASGLADIRKASELTQQRMAHLLGTDQGTVSKIERRGDLLLSTLRQYLAAAGAVHPKIAAEKDGVEITPELDDFGVAPTPHRGHTNQRPGRQARSPTRVRDNASGR